MEEIKRHEKALCIQIMLEAGADFLLESDYGFGSWMNAYVGAVDARSLVSTPIHSQLNVC